MTERERLTTERRKIFARESLTLMSMPKEELRHHYNEIFDRLQEYEAAEENNQIIVPPCKVGDTVYETDGIRIYELTILDISLHKNKPYYETESLDFDDYAIGKSIFLTREEAEKALEAENEKQN